MKISGATDGGSSARIVVSAESAAGRKRTDVTTKSGGPTPNDQRADAKNPTSPAHKQAQDNRANQLNPNHGPTKSK